MASRRVPLSKDEIAQLQRGTEPISILGLGGVVLVAVGLAMIVFEWAALIISILPILLGVVLIGYAIKSYLDLKKDLNHSYKDIVSGKVEMKEIRYPSTLTSTKITYELVAEDRVKITEKGFNSNKTSTFDIATDYWLRKVHYNFYVTIDGIEYKIPGLDFFALKKGDPLELEVLPSGEVLKVNKPSPN